MMTSINGKVGKNALNSRMDVNKVINLLKKRKMQRPYISAMRTINIPNPNETNVNQKITEAITLFQKHVQKMRVPDGSVSPNGNTILFLGGIRSSGKVIIVDLDDQNLYAYEGKNLVHSFFCASGDKTHPTAVWPAAHKIFRKHEVYRSKKYDAQMDYAMFFTQDGKAIHQSNAVGVTSILKDWGVDSLGSHGCVRLSEDNAKTLFKWASMQTTVFIDLEKI